MSAVALFERQISTELGSGRLAVQCSLVGEAASHPAAPRAVSFSPAHYAKAAPSDRGILERRVYLHLPNLALVKGKYEVIGSFSLHQNQ